MKDTIMNALGGKVAEDVIRKKLSLISDEATKKLLANSYEVDYPLEVKNTEGEVVGTFGEIHMLKFESSHLLSIYGADEEGFRLSIEVFIQPPWLGCDCEPDHKDPVVPNVILDLLEISREGLIDTAHEESTSKVRENYKEVVGRHLYKRYFPVSIGKTYLFIDNELDDVDGHYLYVTNIYTCPKLNIRMVAGLMITEDGFNTASAIPYFCIEREVELVSKEEFTDHLEDMRRDVAESDMVNAFSDF